MQLICNLQSAIHVLSFYKYDFIAVGCNFQRSSEMFFLCNEILKK